VQDRCQYSETVRTVDAGTEYQLTIYRMLFEFHKKQNARKPNAVHATYLVTGIPRRSEHTNGVNGRIGEDTDMRGSPFMSSMPEPEESGDSDYTSESDDENTAAPKGVRETQIVLVREEELEGASVLDSYMCQPG
jgi:DNA polymerase delta subunit 3